MAKQLGEIKLLVVGDENGPVSAHFKYQVASTEDTDLVKCGVLVLESPGVGDIDLKSFFDGYVQTIKDNEGIS